MRRSNLEWILWRWFMMNGKCGRKKLCPVSFGLALGLTAMLGYVFWILWATYYGPTPMMESFNIALPTFGEGAFRAFCIFLKGLVFGFFVALFYDWISCCCKNKFCCKKCDNKECCNCGNKSDSGMVR
jgi:hypothetical protein